MKSDELRELQAIRKLLQAIADKLEVPKPERRPSGFSVATVVRGPGGRVITTDDSMLPGQLTADERRAMDFADRKPGTDVKVSKKQDKK